MLFCRAQSFPQQVTLPAVIPLTIRDWWSQDAAAQSGGKWGAELGYTSCPAPRSLAPQQLPASSSRRVGCLTPLGSRGWWRKERVPHCRACWIALYESDGALNEPSNGSALYRGCKTSGLRLARLSLSEFFSICLQLCFTWFSGNSNFCNREGAHG